MKRSSDILLCAVSTLTAIGVVTIYLVLSARGSTPVVGLRYLVKHLLWLAVGIGGLLALRRIDYRLLERWWWVCALGSLVLLLVVLLPGIGTEKYGARRWIRFGPIGFQPSEVAKLGMVVALAALGTRWSERLRGSWREAFGMLGVVWVTAGLVLAEPDFGTAALLGATGTVVVAVAGARLGPLAAAGGAGTAATAMLLLRSPERMERIFAFLDPWAHRDAAGYQAIQSLTALGSGGVFGRAGMGKLFFLPQADTDFILAVIGEEMGLLGTLGVLCCFWLIAWAGLRIARGARDQFGRLLALGVTVLIVSQALMHAAVVTVSMPTKGIALPFVSSGGSSLVVCLAGTGILLSVARSTERGLSAASGRVIGEVEPC